MADESRTVVYFEPYTRYTIGVTAITTAAACICIGYVAPKIRKAIAKRRQGKEEVGEVKVEAK